MNKECLLCGKRNYKKISTLKNPRKFGERYYDYLQCSNCKIIFLDPMPDDMVLGKIYNDEVYYKKLAQKTPSKFLTRILNFRLFSEYDQFVLENFSKKGGTLLDFGCGNGEFLESVKDNFKVFGYDKSSVSVKNTKRRLKNSVIKTGEFSKAHYPANFDIVTMWHVLEHLPNPKQVLKQLKNKMNKKGILIMEFPNADSLVMKLFKSNYNWIMIPEHIFYYSEKSVKYLLNSQGYSIIKVSFPMRANLNFALSMQKMVKISFGLLIGKIILVSMLPVSIVVSFLASLTGRTEVMRVVAQKN